MKCRCRHLDSVSGFPLSVDAALLPKKAFLRRSGKNLLDFLKTAFHITINFIWKLTEILLVFDSHASKSIEPGLARSEFGLVNTSGLTGLPVFSG